MEDKVLALLNLYYDEWKFRVEGLWKRIMQFFIIIFFVSTFPITINAFNGLAMPKMPIIFFPISGIALTVFYLVFCLSESSRISSIDNKVKQIITNRFPDYHKNELPSFSGKKRAFFVFRWRMAIWVPCFLSVIQIIIACTIIYLISTGALS